MLQRASWHPAAALLLIGAADLRAGQVVNNAVAQRHDAEDATVDQTVAALVAASELVGQLVDEQTAALSTNRLIY